MAYRSFNNGVFNHGGFNQYLLNNFISKTDDIYIEESYSLYMYL